MRGSLRLGRLAGIEVRIHYTWFFIFVFLAWSLAEGFFPRSYPGWERSTYWVIGVAAALLLFVSVLLHELAHSLVARSRGMSVTNITLFIFGGVSNLQGEPQRPWVEFSMAIVGPLTSLALAGTFWGFLHLVADRQSLVAALLFYLALVNGMLAIFNLLPGFPLDGGRVLRSVLWHRTGSLVKATNTAATAGRFLGWGFIGFGLFQLLRGNFLGGLWIAFLGWFLTSAADASRREVTTRELLRGVLVKEVMDPNPETIAPQTSVQELVQTMFRQRRHRAVPVSEDNRVVGIVTVTDIKGVPQGEWSTTPVAEIMTRQPLYSVAPDNDLNTALRLLAEHDINQALVLSQGELVGLLSRADIIHHLRFSQELGMKWEEKGG